MDFFTISVNVKLYLSIIQPSQAGLKQSGWSQNMVSTSKYYRTGKCSHY